MLLPTFLEPARLWTVSVRCLFCLLLLGGLAPRSLAQDPSALFVIHGDFYEYGFFGLGPTVDPIGPAEDGFSITYEFDDGGAADRSIISMLDLSGADGSMSVSLMNEALLQAPRLAGNDHGGGFTVVVDIYVQGPAGTPFYVRRDLDGTVTAVRGGGAGTTQAHLVGSTAVVNNGSGAQSFPVTLTSGRELAGKTSSTVHPSVAGYHLATSVSLPAWGFTYQGIDFCFPSCPELLNFRSTSTLDGSIEAGPCCPESPELDDWNDPRAQCDLPMSNVQCSNNCYNYATNRRNGGYSQPGGLPQGLPEYTCEMIALAAADDGFVPMEFGDPNSCGQGECVVALVVAPPSVNNGKTDYHWYRRNRDGGWSHKAGWAPAGTIADPTDPAARAWGSLPGYSEFCGYYCVPCDFEVPSPSPLSMAPMDARSGGTPAVLVSLGFYSGTQSPEWVMDDPIELDLIEQMINSGSPSTPIVEPAGMGYYGLRITPIDNPAGIPEYVRVFDGIIQIADPDTIMYRTDAMDLEEYLLDRAILEGYGDFVADSVAVSVDPLGPVPAGLAAELTPNPFRTVTQIAFNARKDAHTTVRVYDSRGRLVTSLFDGLALGIRQTAEWLAEDVPAGIYYVRVQSAGDVVVRKVTLLR